MKELPYLIVGVLTAIIAKQINNSIFWVVVDLFFWPFAWIKWLICHDVNLTIIKAAFAWFLK